MLPTKNNSNFPTPGVESSAIVDLWTKLSAHQQALLNDDQNALMLVDLLEEVFNKWRLVAAENAQNHELIGHLKRQCANYEEELNKCQEQLRIANSELVARNANIRALEEELAQYAERFKAAREQFQSAATLTVIPTIQEDILESRTGKRRSNSLGVLPDKKAKRLLEDNLERLCEEDGDDESELAQVVEVQQPRIKRTMNRSMSESRIFEEKKDAAAHQQNQPLSSKGTTASTMDIRLSPMVGFGNGWTKGRPIEECGHSFVAHNNLFSAAFSYCSVCNRSLGMRSLKCNDCKLVIHENCRQNAPFPCVPIIPTPQRNNPKQRPRLADLCPDSQPKIPGQLIRCVVVLERCFINTVGLYRVPGCDNEVKRLYANFNSKYVPKLDQLDPETITGFIKKFLRDLREPLIPFSSFKEFHNAVTSGNEAQLREAIETLPIPNRDTLAFLCAHWQKVAKRAKENQMPLENLAKVLGPTVVGTSSKLTHLVGGGNAGTSTMGDTHACFVEARKQVDILLTLLKMDNEYWVSFYNAPPPVKPGYQSGSNTPVSGSTSTPRAAHSTLVKRHTPRLGH